MRRMRALGLWAMLSVLFVGCASPGGGGPAPTGRQEERPPVRTLIVATRAEPPSLSAKPFRSLGLTAGQTFRHVVLYQAVKAIYPALASQFVLIMLATSVVSSIGATELFNTAAFIDSRTYLSFEAYTLITLSYLVLTLGFRGLFAAIYWLAFVRRPHR